MTFAINSGTFGATSTDIFLVLILAAVFLGGPGPALRGDARRAGHRPGHRGERLDRSSLDYKDVIAFVILLAMLAVRPNGLLGARA